MLLMQNIKQMSHKFQDIHDENKYRITILEEKLTRHESHLFKNVTNLVFEACLSYLLIHTNILV